MSIDRQIFPTGGTWNSIEYCDFRLDEMMNRSMAEGSTYHYLYYDPDTMKLRRNQSNCYTTYAGGDNLCFSNWSTIQYSSSDKQYTVTSSGENSKNVNISFICYPEKDFRSHVSYLNTSAGTQYGDQTLLAHPVIDFNPNTICYGVKVNLLPFNTENEVGQSSYVNVWFNDLLLSENTQYEGLYENGYNDEYYIGGFYLVPYIGSETFRSESDFRMMPVLENNCHPRDDLEDNPLENAYFYGTFSSFKDGATGEFLRTGNSSLGNASLNWSTNGLAKARKSISGGTGTSLCYRDRGIDQDLVISDAESKVGTVGSWGHVFEEGQFFAKNSRWGQNPQVQDYLTGIQVLKSVAALGVFFTGTQTAAESATIGPGTTSDLICLGKIENDGCTYGDYVTGTEAASQRQTLWTKAIEQNDHEPLDPTEDVPEKPEPWEPDPTTTLNSQYHWPIASGTNIYAIGSSQLGEALANLNQRYYNAAAQAEDGSAFNLWKERNFGKWSDPNDCVINIIDYPFGTLDIMGKGGYSGVKVSEIPFGFQTYSSGTSWRQLERAYGVNCVLDGGSVYYKRHFKNFLDFRPYSTAEIYIPYCGSIPIDPEVFIGHTISVKYLIDWLSGACLALVYRDGLVVDQISGQIGNKISLVEANALDFERNVLSQAASIKGAKTQAAMNAGTAAIGIGAGLATGNVGGAIYAGVNSAANLASTVESIQLAEYKLDNTEIGFKQIGSATPITSRANEQKCRLVVYRPTYLDFYDAAEFNRLVGFKTAEQGMLGGYEGFVVAEGVKLDTTVYATEKEQSMIKAALKNGVYITRPA